MPTVADIVDYIFQDKPASPVCKVMGGYRKVQHDFANRVVETIDQSKIPYHRDPSKELARLATSQVPTGVGKTVAYLVPHIANMMLGSGTRLIISTYTIALRDQIIREDVDKAKEMVRLAFDHFKTNGDDIGEAREKKSFSQYASLLRAKRIANQTYTDNDEKTLALEYYKWVEDSYIAHINDPQNTTPPIYSDWLSRNAKPEGWPSELGLHDIERGKSTTDEPKTIMKYNGISDASIDAVFATVEAIRAEQSTIGECKIIVCTHSMFTINNFLFGGKSGLGTNRDCNNAPVMCIIDECDEMVKVAEGFLEHETNLQIMKTIIENAFGKRKLPYKKMTALYDFVKNKTYPLVRQYQYTDVDIETLCNLIDNLSDVLNTNSSRTDLALLRQSCDDGDITESDFDYFKTSMDLLFNIAFMFNFAGCSKAALFERDKAHVVSSVDHTSKGVMIGIKSEEGHIASSAWRNYQIHNYQSIHMISGTIDPRGGSDFSDFEKRIKIGEWDYYDSNRYVTNVVSGDIKKLVITDPKSNIPISTDKEAYAKYIANVLKNVLPDGKTTLVLFLSDDLKRRVHTHLPSFVDDITMKPVGVQPRALFQKHIKADKKHWFGHEWAGTNFVHPHDKSTLFERVIITQFPSPTPDKKRKALPDGLRKLRQGIGRVFRNTCDHPEVWILDPRIGIKTRKHGNKYDSTKNVGVRTISVTGTIEEALLRNSEICIINANGHQTTI